MTLKVTFAVSTLSKSHTPGNVMRIIYDVLRRFVAVFTRSAMTPPEGTNFDEIRNILISLHCRWL